MPECKVFPNPRETPAELFLKLPFESIGSNCAVGIEYVQEVIVRGTPKMGNRSIWDFQLITENYGFVGEGLKIKAGLPLGRKVLGRAAAILQEPFVFGIGWKI